MTNKIQVGIGDQTINMTVSDDQNTISGNIEFVFIESNRNDDECRVCAFTISKCDGIPCSSRIDGKSGYYKAKI